MTAKEYDMTRQLLKNDDICDFAERMCQKGEVNPIKDYPQCVGSDVMPSAARRQLYIGRAIDLIRRMIFLGATSLEILRASEYLMVLIGSVEHSLDYKCCEVALKIKELERKYSLESFFEMPFDELQDVIKRDNGYYPVPIGRVTE